MRIADQLQVDCPVFYVDNVADYYVAHREAVNVDDLPRVTPPYPDMWIEFQTRRTELPGVPNGLLRCALRLRTLRDPPPEDLAVLASSGFSLQGSRRVGWLTMVRFYHQIEGYPKIRESTENAVWIDTDGRSICVQGRPEFPEERAPIKPALLAISFMHCKNVKRVENVPGGAFERARKRRGEPPSLKFYTLEIEPMKQVLRTEGRVGEVGLKKALHICRGHFATFTADKPMFGRPGAVGTVWREAHVRGTAERGAVVKDYAVKAPVPDGEKIH